jgi:hypothetical protein
LIFAVENERKKTTPEVATARPPHISASCINAERRDVPAMRSPYKNRLRRTRITRKVLAVEPAKQKLRVSRSQLAYVVFRLGLGIKMLIHGSSRFLGPGVEAFSSKTTSEFAGTPLSAGLVHAFLIVLPFAEFILGI